MRRGGCAIKKRTRSDQVPRPFRFVFSQRGREMWRTIEFDNYATFRTIKIDNIATYARLSAELLSEKSATPKVCPQDCLSRRSGVSYEMFASSKCHFLVGSC